MIAQQLTRHQTTLKALNSTPLSQHLASLMTEAGVPILADHLVATSLALWATEELTKPQWARAANEAVMLLEMDDPEALQDAITDESILDAATMEEAGRMMLRLIADLPIGE